MIVGRSSPEHPERILFRVQGCGCKLTVRASTGVTKFSQVRVFSGFNQPKDISMDGRYEGITEEELYRYFAVSIDKRKLYSIGVSYSSDTGTVDDWKVLC